MKKFLLTLSMFSVASVSVANEPTVVKAPSMIAKVKSYVPETPEFVTKSVESVKAAIVAHPFRAVAIAAITTFAVVKALDYASASEDEDDNF